MTKPRCFFYRQGDRVLGTVEEYLHPALAAAPWRAVSFVNDNDGGRQFATSYEAEQWLIVQAEMVE